MKLLVIFSVLFLISVGLCAQNFVGKITDKNGEPVYGGTVFIKEANQGVACNEDGEFRITLSAKDYTVEYRCLGYETITETITLRKGSVTTRNVTMTEKVFELAQVTITNKEDPAYEIMRKVIEKAPYHLNRVKSYKAEVYIKGNMELTKVSKLMDNMAKMEEGIKISDFKEKTLVQESYNEIEFSAPDEYKQTVKAFSSTIPNNFDPKESMKVIQTNLYAPVSPAGLVSPLHPKSFSYYKFRYEGFSDEGGEVINKIQLTPKLKDPQFFSGYIYIADGTWDIRHADISTDAFGVKQEVNITFNKVLSDIYMPTAYNNRISADIMGIGGDFNYISSLKYLEISENQSAEIITPSEKKKKKSLEIKHDEKYKIENDTLATKRDSLYWTDVRNVPLNDKEIASYVRKDSLQQYVDSINRKTTNSKFKKSDILTGGKIGGDSTLLSFKFGGLLKAVPEYNFVDGFWIGQKFEIGTHWNKTRNRLTVSPEVYYTTARKDIVWKTDVKLQYSPMRFGESFLSGGDIAADFNPTGNNRLDNTLSSLIDGKNVSMFYRKKFVNAFNNVDLANGLRLNTGFEIAKRSGLENNTRYNFFNAERKVKPNLYIPGNFDLTAYHVGLVYTPRQYYSIYKERKYYREAKSPTFRVNYSEGFSSWQTNNSRYRKIDGGISQTFKTDLFGTLSYDVSGGSYLGDKSRVNFADWQHFNATDLFFVTRSPDRMFLLLDRYQASTNRYWIEGHINYNSRYIFLKRLPFLQGKLFNESLQLRYLYTPEKRNYNEVGYSVDLMKLINLGIHCSFDKLKYESFGVRLIFDLSVMD